MDDLGNKIGDATMPDGDLTKEKLDSLICV
jgi:hypothetical protein